jgi:hypothetical protein
MIDLYYNPVDLNRPQLLSVLNLEQSEVNIEGRGTGKSYKIGCEINNKKPYGLKNPTIREPITFV